MAVARHEQPLFDVGRVGTVARQFCKKASSSRRRLRWWKNLERILKQSKQINAVGVDISPASIQVTKKKNSRAVKDGRLQVVQGQAESLPFASNLFDLVTAFETVYFWDIEKGLAEVYRTLKKGGQLLIVNESQSSKGIEEYKQSIGFTVYTKDELCKIVKKAGFKNIRSDIGENGGWFAIVCEK